MCKSTGEEGERLVINLRWPKGDKKALEKVADRTLNFLPENAIIAHYGTVDHRLLEDLMEQTGRGPHLEAKKICIIDLLAIIRKIFHKKTPYGLAYLHACLAPSSPWFGKNHRANADCFILRE